MCWRPKCHAEIIEDYHNATCLSMKRVVNCRNAKSKQSKQSKAYEEIIEISKVRAT